MGKSLEMFANPPKPEDLDGMLSDSSDSSENQGSSSSISESSSRSESSSSHQSGTSDLYSSPESEPESFDFENDDFLNYRNVVAKGPIINYRRHTCIKRDAYPSSHPTARELIEDSFEEDFFTEIALKRILIKCKNINTKWSLHNIWKFERGIIVFGKNFYKIKKELFDDKTTKEVVEFYYSWKRDIGRDTYKQVKAYWATNRKTKQYLKM